MIDLDGDGVVSRGREMKSLVEILTTLGEPLTDEETDAFLDDVDLNKDGQISHDEFMHVLAEDGG